jgi:predicted metal-dependent enzyme (double-stranded beta helix superfamily)
MGAREHLSAARQFIKTKTRGKDVVTMTEDNLQERRRQCIAATLSRVRSLDPGAEAAPARLAAVKSELINLARSGVFNTNDFPMAADGSDQTYCLHMDDDGRFGLYLLVGQHCHWVPPHNHKTWAVIAGISGVETNILYAQEQFGSAPTDVCVQARAEVPIRAGCGLALGPLDVHAIRLDGGDQVTMSLHLYGLATEQQVERVKYDAGGYFDGFYESAVDAIIPAFSPA